VPVAVHNHATGRPLRVGLNLMFLGERAGGVGRYAIELPGALLEAEPHTELHIFISHEAPQELRGQPWAGGVRWVQMPSLLGPAPARKLAEYALLPVLARARRLDVLHSPANTGPVIAPGVPTVLSLHDLIWLHHAEEWDASLRAQRSMRVLVGHGVRHAGRIFADSAAAAEDFVRTLGVPRERIDVTHLGVRPPGAPPQVSEQALRERLRLGSSRILLCVAQKRPYKNLHSLVRALPQLAQDVTLVLPGSPTPYEGELRSIAAQLGVQERVCFPDWLSEDELERLYAASAAFMLPSLIEGFGLPVLEAMARGVPVACSDVSALPEVVGDAALLFDPRRQEDVTGAAARLLSDAPLCAELVQRGHRRVADFSWKHTGAASLAGYRNAIAGAHLRPGAPGIS